MRSAQPARLIGPANGLASSIALLLLEPSTYSLKKPASHALGAPLQAQPASTVQVGEQPSPAPLP